MYDTTRILQRLFPIIFMQHYWLKIASRNVLEISIRSTTVGIRETQEEAILSLFCDTVHQNRKNISSSHVKEVGSRLLSHWWQHILMPAILFMIPTQCLQFLMNL